MKANILIARVFVICQNLMVGSFGFILTVIFFLNFIGFSYRTNSFPEKRVKFDVFNLFDLGKIFFPVSLLEINMCDIFSWMSKNKCRSSCEKRFYEYVLLIQV